MNDDLRRLEDENARLREALRLGEERFRALMEETSDLLAVFAPDATIKYANAASGEVLGYAPADMLGKVAHDLVVPEDQAKAMGALGGLADKPGGTTRVVLRMRRSDGSTRIFDAMIRNLLHVPSVGSAAVPVGAGRAVRGGGARALLP